MFSALHLPPSPQPPPREALLQFVSSLTPDFEETAPGTFLLDLLTLPHAQAAPEDWIDRTLRKATILRAPVHLSLASTPDLAHLAALSSRSASTLTVTPHPTFHIHPPHSTTSALLQLPLHHSALHPSHSAFRIPHSDLLQLWGLQTLGDLAALPRQGLGERLGPEIVRLHDILHGKHRRLLTLHRPPQHFQASRELEHPLETLEPLLFLLHRCLDTLCSRLAASQRAAQGLRLSLTFDDGNLHLREFRIPEPTRTPATLLRLLHTHLDTLSAPAPVTAFSLRILPTLPHEAQNRLFERSLRDPNKFSDTLARIEALLGPGRLGTPLLLDTHKPDSFEMRSAECGPRNVSSPLPAPHSEFRIPTSLPLRRFRPPLPVRVATESRSRHPVPLALLDGPHPGPIAHTRGPFPLSGHWWEPTQRWQRTEWDVELPDRTLLRLAFLSPHSWQLEGRY